MITGLGKGTYNTGNPITAANLLPLGGSSSVQTQSLVKYSFTAVAAGANQVITLPGDFYQINSVQGVNIIYSSEFIELPPNQVQIIPPIEIGEVVEIHYWNSQTSNVENYTKSETDALFNGFVSKSLTGDVLILSSILGNNYNYLAPSASVTYTTTSAVVNGYASVSINAPSEPVVTGATKILGSPFVPNTDMEMIVESMDGINIRYFFLAI